MVRLPQPSCARAKVDEAGPIRSFVHAHPVLCFAKIKCIDKSSPHRVLSICRAAATPSSDLKSRAGYCTGMTVLWVLFPF